MSEVTNTNPPEATRWKPGQSGNPAGKPKGAIHLATRIQNMLNDDEFTTELLGKGGKKITFKGNPAEAIIRTAILKAMSGDKMWADWLAKNGFGSYLHHDFNNSPIDQILEQYGLTQLEQSATHTAEQSTPSKPITANSNALEATYITEQTQTGEEENNAGQASETS